MSKRKTRKSIAFTCIALILVLVIIFSGLQILESTVLRGKNDPDGTIASKAIVRDGVKYYPRRDITVIMMLGIDESGPVKSSESYRNTGDCDMVALLILDDQAETYSVLCLNRDTMVNMPVLGLGGRVAGSFYGQLTLSHTYGSGLEDSCENTKKTVSDLLYGLDIDHYVSIHMDAIPIMNDLVGGVTVNVADDFSAIDPDITKGEFTLRGDQALTFVRTRKDVGDQMNLSRMERHEEYMDGFMDSLIKKIDESDTFVLSMYDDISDYIVTDCSINQISGLLRRCGNYQRSEILSPEGENKRGEEYMEFYLDEKKLDELIIDLFYAKTA